MLFNRFYQLDFDLERMAVLPTLHVSSPAELLLRLHWTAILFGRVRADLAVTGGVLSHLDVLKVLAAGGRVTMMTSVLLMHGIEITRPLSDLMKKLDAEVGNGQRASQQAQSGGGATAASRPKPKTATKLIMKVRW